MNVLLIEDVDNLGYAGDVKKVANGFGRNYLLPQRMAVLATPGALKQAETIRKTAEKRRAQEMEDAKAIASQIEGLELVFERRAGEMGKLYGSVTSAEIAEAIEEKSGIPIDKRKVALPEPVRSLGVQDVDIKLMIDLKTSIKVEVLPLGGILERSRLSAKELAEADPESVEDAATAAVPEASVVEGEEAEESEAVEEAAPVAEMAESEEASEVSEEAEAEGAEAEEAVDATEEA